MNIIDLITGNNGVPNSVALQRIESNIKIQGKTRLFPKGPAIKHLAIHLDLSVKIHTCISHGEVKLTSGYWETGQQLLN